MYRPRTPIIQCEDCRFSGPAIDAHQGYRWWMIPIGFLATLTGIGALYLISVMANWTYKACPRCRSRRLATGVGAVTPEMEEIVNAGLEYDRRLLWRNKATVLIALFSVLALCVGYAVYIMQFYLPPPR